MTLRSLILALVATSAPAQNPAPLPSNYKPILDNADVLVQRVHYGPHEFVPMHDHPAVATVYVYLNNSGGVDIAHETGFTLHRPPTHTGAFRVAPGMAERHSITNLSDLPSDSLRVELKRLPANSLQQPFRGPAPSPPQPGTHTEFTDPALRIERIVCPAVATTTTPCEVAPSTSRSLLVALTPLEIQTPAGNQALQSGDVQWLPPTTTPSRLTPASQSLRITLLYP